MESPVRPEQMPDRCRQALGGFETNGNWVQLSHILYQVSNISLP